MDALATVTHDDCCSGLLIAALHADSQSVSNPWTCPNCEMEWRRELHQFEPGEGMFHWSPHCPVLVFKL